MSITATTLYTQFIDKHTSRFLDDVEKEGLAPKGRIKDLKEKTKALVATRSSEVSQEEEAGM